MSSWAITIATMIDAPPAAVPPQERLAAIDILRGLALFGVMAVNIVTEFRVSIFQQFLPPKPSPLLADRFVAAAPLQTLDQVLTHPQVLANDMMVKAKAADGSELTLLGTPFKLGDAMDIASRPPPQLGADTGQVLRDELGLDDADIASLREQGAL